MQCTSCERLLTSDPGPHSGPFALSERYCTYHLALLFVKTSS